MASATATATMAAAGIDKRPSSGAASSLQTPGSGTFPSELLSPMAASPALPHPRKDDLRTPITPPSAYLDFLKNMSPAMLSPASAGTGGRFHFPDKAPFSSTPSVELTSDKPSTSPPVSHKAPASLSRNTSYDSNASASTDYSLASRASSTATAASAGTRTRPESPRVVIPPTSAGFAKPSHPRSARSTPRRLHIPQSPFSMPPGPPNSAHSVPSPYSSTPLSAAPWSASFRPHDADGDGAAPFGKPGKVSVRQVVTRTVTYCRTPLDPAPKGKRRKIEVEGEDGAKIESRPSSAEVRAAEEERVAAAVVERPIKMEKRDDFDARDVKTSATATVAPATGCVETNTTTAQDV